MTKKKSVIGMTLQEIRKLEIDSVKANTSEVKSTEDTSREED